MQIPQEVCYEFQIKSKIVKKENTNVLVFLNLKIECISGKVMYFVEIPFLEKKTKFNNYLSALNFFKNYE